MRGRVRGQAIRLSLTTYTVPKKEKSQSDCKVQISIEHCTARTRARMCVRACACVCVYVCVWRHPVNPKMTHHSGEKVVLVCVAAALSRTANPNMTHHSGNFSFGLPSASDGHHCRADHTVNCAARTRGGGCACMCGCVGVARLWVGGGCGWHS